MQVHANYAVHDCLLRMLPAHGAGLSIVRDLIEIGSFGNEHVSPWEWQRNCDHYYEHGVLLAQ